MQIRPAETESKQRIAWFDNNKMASQHQGDGQSTSSAVANKRKQLAKSETVDITDEGSRIQTLGENSGLGRVLIGLRYQSANSCLEVRIVRGDGIRRSGDGGKPPASTYCSVVFLPDCTESVATATVDSTVGCPRWKGAFRFEKFPKVAGAGASSQRCMQVQVRDPAAGGAAISEATLLLSHWSEEDYERGISVRKYLNDTQESQRVGSKEGTAFLTLYCRPDKFKLTLNRIEDLNPRHTSGTEPEGFYCRLQAVMQHRGLIKETIVRGSRDSTPGSEVNFLGFEFSVRLHGKHGGGGGVEALTVRLVLSKQQNGQHQEICWVDLGSDVKWVDCRGLYKSVMENPNQPHVISVHMNRPPAPSGLEGPAHKHRQPQPAQGSGHRKHEA